MKVLISVLQKSIDIVIKRNLKIKLFLYSTNENKNPIIIKINMGPINPKFKYASVTGINAYPCPPPKLSLTKLIAKVSGLSMENIE